MTDTTQTPEDEFSAAFAELQVPAASSTPTAAAAPSAPAEAAVSPSAAAPASAEAPAPAAAVPPGDAGNASAGTAAATPAGSAEASTPTAAQPAATPASEAQPDLAAQFAALQAELAELKKNPPAAAPAPTPTPTPAAPAPIYDADEQKLVDSYMKEWPDVAKGEALLRRAEYQQLVGFMMEQFRPRIEALEAQTSTVSTRTQYQDLVTLVPDYDAVRDATLAWIDTQPDYLKDAYQQVANTGSAKQVADLIGRFKKETNYVAPASGTPAATPAPAAAAAAPAAPATPAAPALAPAAAAAAASLRVVKSSRSEPVSQPDPNDFDAAFKEFAANA
jgi:hypothetical protein